MILMVFPYLAVANTAVLIGGGGGVLKFLGGAGRGGRAPSLDPPLFIQQLCKFLGMKERVQFLRFFVILTWLSCPHYVKTILNLFFFFFFNEIFTLSLLQVIGKSTQ